MTTMDNIKTLVDEAIEYGAKKTNAIIARAILGKNTQIRFSQNSIDISKKWNSLQLELFVLVKEKKTGSIVRSIESVNEVKQTVDDVVSFTEILPDSMFFAGIEENTHHYPTLTDRYDEKIDSFAEEAPEIINSAIEQAVSEGAIRAAGALMMREQQLVFRSSLGPEGSRKASAFDLNIRAFQNELDYSGQGLISGTMPSKTKEGMVEAGAKAGRLSKYDLILSPAVGANVIGGLPESANPFYIMMGLSPLGDKMGEQIAPEIVTTYEDPLFPGGIESTAFDWEGTPSKTVKIIDKGVLKAMVHNTTTANMFETESTGSSRMVDMGGGAKMLLPASSNLVFENGKSDMDELLDVDRPTIYVTCNWYTRFQNYQTGDFSTIPRDAMFLVNKGELKPIKNMRISDNVMRMLANIDALGNDRTQVYWWEVQTPTVIPTMRIRDCRMTAATQ